MFPFINLRTHTKYQVNSSIRPWDIAKLKILHSDWSRAFLSISQELELLQVWKFYREVANGERFHFRPNPRKANDKIFKNPEKPYFGPIFPIFRPLIFFFQNQALSRLTLHWSLSTYQFSIKSEKMPRQTDGRDWFYRTTFGHRPWV